MEFVAVIQEYWPHAVAGGTTVAGLAAFFKLTQEMAKLRLEKKKLLLEIENLQRQKGERTIPASDIRVATLEETAAILSVRGIPQVAVRLFATDRERNDPMFTHFMLPPQPISLFMIFGLFALPALLLETYASGALPQAWWLAPATLVAGGAYWLRISRFRNEWVAETLEAARRPERSRGEA